MCLLNITSYGVNSVLKQYVSLILTVLQSTPYKRYESPNQF